MKKKITMTGIISLILAVLVFPQICIGADYDITKGTPFEYDGIEGKNQALSKIDDSHYLCAYEGDDYDGYAVVLIVDMADTTISKGTAYEFDISKGRTPALSKIDDTHYLCAYEGSDAHGYAVVLIVNTTDWTITKGTAYEYDIVQGRTPHLAQIDSTHYLCAYWGPDHDGWSVVLIVNTTDWTITKGTAYEFDTVQGKYPYLSKIDATHYLCAYAGDDYDGYAVVLIVNTTDWTITKGTAYEYDIVQGRTPHLAQIDSTHYLCAYWGPDHDGWSVVLIVNTTDWTITKGTAYEFDAVFGWRPALSKIDDTHHLCSYRGPESDGWSVVLIVDTGDWTISQGTAFEFDAIDGRSPALSQIDTYHHLCAYEGSGTDGWSVVLNVELPAGGADVTVTGTSIAPGGTSPGTTGVGMLKLSLVTDTGSATWTAVKVDLTGTAINTDISSVEIWKDDGDGNWEVGEDTQIGSGSFSSSANITFGTPETITTTSWDYYVVYDIASGADPSHTAGAKLLDNSYITVSSPATVSDTGFPIESGLCTLPVELSSFTVQFLNSVPTLNWSTASENDNIGWFIYRNCTDASFGDAEIINSELIPGYGSTSEPHEYIYQDVTIETTPGDVYWYWIQSVDLGGMTHLFGPREINIPEDPEEEPEEQPKQYGLHQNKPNSFGISEGSTKISFILPSTALAEVKIYNIHGGLVRSLYTGMADADEKVELIWDGKDENGIEQQNGIYLYQLEVDDTVNEIKRLILLR